MMKRILMVCLGNICRSPLAEGILKSKVSIEKVHVDSAGTSNYHVGDRPDPRSVSIAKKYGLDISNQRGRQFDISDFDRFDLIYTMDSANYNHVIQLARGEEDVAKVKMIMDEIYPDSQFDVPDPYFGGDHGFDAVFKMLDEACDIISEKINH